MFLLRCLWLVGVATGCDLSQRIIGGNRVVIEQFPYQVAIERSGFPFCGGSIIASNKILTAAHCVEKGPHDDLQVRAGSSFRGRGGQVVDVNAVHIHPLYENTTFSNDVSVLSLANHFRYGPAIQPIRLAPPGTHVPPGAPGIVTGWGLQGKRGKMARQLQAVTVYSMPQSICQKIYQSKGMMITGAMMCFHNPGGGKDACQGDSGGPLVYNGMQIGVVSWGIGCGSAQYPGVFSRVSALRNHIDFHAYYSYLFPYQLSNL